MEERIPTEDPLTGRIKRAYTGNWWALFLRAIAAIVLAIVAFMYPVKALGFLVILFGVYALADGILAVIASIRGLRRGDKWGAMLAEGLLGIAAGLIALTWPGITAVALALLVAAWALITGLFEVAAAIKLRKVIENEWLLILGGVLSIIFGILVMMRPGAGVITLVFLLGAYALAYGIVTLVLAFKVRSWVKAHAI